jgi:hypothetical protein
MKQQGAASRSEERPVELLATVRTTVRLPESNRDINMFFGKLKEMMDCVPSARNKTYDKLMWNLITSQDTSRERGFYSVMLPCLLVKGIERYTARLNIAFANKEMCFIYNLYNKTFCYTSDTSGATSEVELKLVEVTKVADMSVLEKKKQ